MIAGDEEYDFGMIGLGTMGCNLLLNIADHGFSVSGYDKDIKKVETLEAFGSGKPVKGFVSLTDFVQRLKRPRRLMMLVPAGKIVDDVIGELIPLMERGDLIIDGGNSHFTDTDRRLATLEANGIHFFGVGVSGGEAGARYGPSMMPGGNKQAYAQVKPIFEAIAASVDGQPCVTYIGPGASGHFVKMVHNGIEYAVMQLIAETYELLKNGLGLDNVAIHAVFEQWNQGRLQSYLMEITARIFVFKTPGARQLLVDEIKDEAGAKGTGKWTSQIAMDLALPVPVIDTAVSMRYLSGYKSLREQLAAIYGGPTQERLSTLETDQYLIILEQAFYFCLITAYAQGMHLLHKASQAYDYHLKLDQIARIWRGGCIIRAEFLEDIYRAFSSNAGLEHLLTDQRIQATIKDLLPSIRTVVSDAAGYGLALPAYASALSYFDAFRSARMPANLIQAQRDFFGAHTYELIGKEGSFHTAWVMD